MVDVHTQDPDFVCCLSATVQHIQRRVRCGIGLLFFIVGGILARLHLEGRATLRGVSLAAAIWIFSCYALSVMSSESAVMSELATYIGLDDGKHLLLFSDVLLFVGIGGGLGYLLRFVGLRYRFGTIAEVVFTLAGGAVVLLHITMHLIVHARPISLIQGFEPYDLILGIGVVAAMLIMILTLRHRFIGSLIVGIILLGIVGGAAYWLRDDAPLMDILDPNQSGQAKGAQDRLNNEQPPEPIAVARFETDFKPPKPILYFRQQVLSFYDGMRFSTEPTPRFDVDVIQRFPADTPMTTDYATCGYRTDIRTCS